jgi:long-chain acyl-CoA synthetase
MSLPKLPPLRLARLAARVDAWPNLVTMFLDVAEERGDAPFLSKKVDGAWKPLSWAESRDAVASLSAALIDLGINRGDRVALVSENRPEWCLADLAIMATGAITVPAYTTNTEADHAHILGNSGARAVIVSGAKLAATLLPAVTASEHCRIVIGMDHLKDAQRSDSDVRVHQWEALVAARAGSLVEDSAAVRARATMQRHDLACLIYTSGTGGAPRGVRQHHGAIMRNIAGAITVIEQDFVPGEPHGELFLSFLPLSHAYEHTAGQYMPMGMGGQIFYCEGLEKLAANIEETQPTFMVVVPRLFEVLRTRIAKQIEKQGGVAVTLLNQALRLARKEARNEPLNIADKLLDAALERTIRKSIRAKFGGRLKGLVAGGAPLNPEVGIFFAAIGIAILQGYGQTEAGPVISCNRPRARLKMHTVGPPLDGVEVFAGPQVPMGPRGWPAKARSVLQLGQPNLLHLHGSGGDTAYLMLRCVMQWGQRIPRVVTEHQYFGDGALPTGVLWTHRLANARTAVSPFLAKRFEPIAPVDVVPNCWTAPLPHQLRQAHSGGRRILHVGDWVDATKGISPLLKAWRLQMRLVPDAGQGKADVRIAREQGFAAGGA